MSSEDMVRSGQALPPTGETGGGADEREQIARAIWGGVPRIWDENPNPSPGSNLAYERERAYAAADRVRVLTRSGLALMRELKSVKDALSEAQSRSEMARGALQVIASRQAGDDAPEWAKAGLDALAGLIEDDDAGFAPEARITAQSSLSAEGAQEACAASDKPTEPNSCQCPSCTTGPQHLSSCAVHNAPALPIGPCDCGGEA